MSSIVVHKYLKYVHISCLFVHKSYPAAMPAVAALFLREWSAQQTFPAACPAGLGPSRSARWKGLLQHTFPAGQSSKGSGFSAPSQRARDRVRDFQFLCFLNVFFVFLFGCLERALQT